MYILSGPSYCKNFNFYQKLKHMTMEYKFCQWIQRLCKFPHLSVALEKSKLSGYGPSIEMNMSCSRVLVSSQFRGPVLILSIQKSWQCEKISFLVKKYMHFGAPMTALHYWLMASWKAKRIPPVASLIGFFSFSFIVAGRLFMSFYLVVVKTGAAFGHPHTSTIPVERSTKCTKHALVFCVK